MTRSERKFRIQSEAGIGQALKNAGSVLTSLLNTDSSKDGYELVIRNYKSKRSLEQNNRYWAMLRQVADNMWMNGKRFMDKTWHKYFKGQFIGYNEISMPDGTTDLEPISTTTLNVEQFTTYMMQIEQWCAEQGYPIMQEELVA